MIWCLVRSSHVMLASISIHFFDENRFLATVFCNLCPCVLVAHLYEFLYVSSCIISSFFHPHTVAVTYLEDRHNLVWAGLLVILVPAGFLSSILVQASSLVLGGRWVGEWVGGPSLWRGCIEHTTTSEQHFSSLQWCCGRYKAYCVYSVFVSIGTILYAAPTL